MRYFYTNGITKGKLTEMGPIIHHLLNVQVKNVGILQVLLLSQIPARGKMVTVLNLIFHITVQIDM